MMHRTLAAILLLLLLGACGQSGPLYIPGNPSRIEQPPPAAESTAEEEDEGEEDGDKDK
jgi:predicted small lipoprotein YifL